MNQNPRRRLKPLLFVVVGGVTLAGQPRCLIADTFALVVGVNECPDFRLAGGVRPRPLRGAETDAESFAKVLLEQFRIPKDRLRLLRGCESTLGRVRAEWKELANRAKKPTDRLLFYFAGHGAQIRDVRPLDEEVDGLDEALCLSDATAEGKNLLVDDELAAWIDETAAGRVTVILDCCHAGTGAKDGNDELASRFLPIASSQVAVGNAPRPWQDLRDTSKSFDKQITALFACRPQQQAYERRLPGQAGSLRSGQFTHYLLAGLQDNRADSNRNGVVSGQEILDYVLGRLEKEFNQSRPEVADRQEASGDGLDAGTSFLAPEVEPKAK